MLFSLDFVTFMGNFCKVFAAYKQIRDSMAFFLSNRWYSVFVVNHNKFLVSLKKFPFLPFLKRKWCYQMEYA